MRQGDCDQRPGICGRGWNSDGSLRSTAEGCLHLKFAATIGAAVDPERQRGVRRAAECIVVQVEGCPGSGRDCDGITARMRSCCRGKINGGPAIILPGILKRIGIDRLVGAGRRCSEECGQNCPSEHEVRLKSS